MHQDPLVGTLVESAVEMRRSAKVCHARARTIVPVLDRVDLLEPRIHAKQELCARRTPPFNCRRLPQRRAVARLLLLVRRRTAMASLKIAPGILHHFRRE